jgi:membrane fusion protein, gold/copper resistance efflux system
MRRSVLASLPVVTALALLVGCNQPPAGAGGGAMPAPPVGVATPIAKDLATTRELTGRLEAMATVDLRPQVGGRITQVLVEDGALVTAGQLLFTIDEAPLTATLAQAKAEVARAEARLTQAKQQFERAKRLVADKIVSQQAYDDAESAQNAATAEQAAAVAALNKAQLDLDHAQITAPIAGRIGKVLATTGNLAQASGPAQGTLLATLVSVDPVYAVFDLDETTWRSVGARLRASANTQGKGTTAVPVGVALAGETGFPHPGTVSFVDNQIDSASGTIRIRATLANPTGDLTPGAFARIQLETAAPKPVLLINEKAVQAQLTTRYVLVVDDQGGTSFRPVQLGAVAGSLRVVNAGLAPTDKIAVNNLTKIFYPGMKVAPVPAAMETTENLAAPGQPGAAKPAGIEKSTPDKPTGQTEAKPAEGASK